MEAAVAGMMGVEQLAPERTHQDRHGVEREAADVDARLASGQIGREQAGIFHGLPADFQQQALLRIHVLRFPRRNAEEQRIEGVHGIAQETGAPHDGLARDGRVFAVEAVRTPAILRHVDDRIPAAGEQGPETFRTVDAARKPTSHSNDRDGLLTSRGHADIPY